MSSPAPVPAAWAGLPTASPGARGAAGLGRGPTAFDVCGNKRPVGAGTSLGARHHGHFPLGLQLRLEAPSFPRGPGCSSASSPPPDTHTHTPCGLEQPCYSITTRCGVGRAKPSCRQRGGALQASLGQTRGLEAPRRPPVPQPDLPQKASGVPIGTSVCQHGHGFSLRTHWYPLHPTPFPLPPRHPALHSKNIPYPGLGVGRGRCWSRCLVTLPFSRAELGKVLAGERPVLPSQNWGEWVASGGLLRS